MKQVNVRRVLVLVLVFNQPIIALADGIVGWGDNYFGQASPPTGNSYVAVSAGAGHSLALKSDGSVVGWGFDYYNQASPPAETGFTAVAAGDYHSLALKSDGSIVGWGRNDYSQALPPVATGFLAIAAGGDTSLALKSDGSIVGWGDDHFGQASPPTGNDFITIAAGNEHGAALKSDGSIKCWGSNSYGQAAAPDGNDFVAICAGGYHNLALKADGSIVGWGWDGSGQATPPAGTDFVAVAAGGEHSLALKADGSIICWGKNNLSQSSPPAGVSYTEIAAGSNHGLALIRPLETGTAFTYHGRLMDAGNPAEGLYDLQFALFNSLMESQGETVYRDDVSVVDGYFATDLNFGTSVFSGDACWLEIAVRPGASTDPTAFVPLSPLQELRPTPYAQYAAKSDWKGLKNMPDGFADGVDDAGLAVETDPTVLASVKDGVSWVEISGIPAGFSDGIDNDTDTHLSEDQVEGYIANDIATGYIPYDNGMKLVSSELYYTGGNLGFGKQNPAAKLDVAGDISTDANYRIAGKPILTASGDNLFIGFDAGENNTTGFHNTFSGRNAGYSNTTGAWNTFSGYYVGHSNTTGNCNTFSGSSAGMFNTTGASNTFSGHKAGFSNTTGSLNTFLGGEAGYSNTTGDRNTFLGLNAGHSNTTGYSNTFSGHYAGFSNTTGMFNTRSGYYAGYSNTTGNFNTCSGCFAGYYNETGSSNVFLGFEAGFNETGSDKLYIANGRISTLICGDFSAKTLGFGTTSIPTGQAIATWTGAYLTTGGAWTNNSSRDAKENFEPVDCSEVLERLVTVPVSTWNYKTEDASVRHMGPIAQDLYEAFALGGDDEAISTCDSDGLALAAIQGLYHMVKEKDTAIASLENHNKELQEQNRALELRVAAMEAMMQRLIIIDEK